MIQRTYHIDMDADFNSVINEIKNDNIVADKDHTIIFLNERGYDDAGIKAQMGRIMEAFPGIHVVGISLIGPLTDWVRLRYGSTISVLTFEKSSFDIFRYDCMRMEPEEAAREFSKSALHTPDAKCAFYMSSDVALDPDKFLQNVDEHLADIPVFGTQAGSLRVENERSLVFLDGELYRTNIIMILFHGKDLNVFKGQSFGWRSLGREMTVTESGEHGVVKTIDNRSVLELYDHYLNITFDKDFFANACAFPLIMGTGKYMTSRVPVGIVPDSKSVLFSTEMKPGTKVSLSYAKKEYLMNESLSLANRIIDFSPDSVFVSTCINRRFFLGNELADREINYIKGAFRNVLVGSGFGEILMSENRGGFKNSCLVTLAMREGEPKKAPEAHLSDSSVTGGEQSKPSLSDRLVTFLEATSYELRNTINELTKQASYDQVTDIYNRTWTEKLLHEFVSKKGNDNTSFSVMLFDIDIFKSINDTYGHDIGDDVLYRIAQATSEIIGEDNIVGRWGGDEFLCIFHDKGIAEILPIAEKIRKSVEEGDFRPVNKVTISAGVAEFNEDDSDHEMVIRADKALYHSKHNGRNRVTVYSDDYDDEMENKEL